MMVILYCNSTLHKTSISRLPMQQACIHPLLHLNTRPKMANILHLCFRQALYVQCRSEPGSMTGFRLSRTKSNVKAHLKLSKRRLELKEVDTTVIQLQEGCLCLQVGIHIIPVISNVHKTDIHLYTLFV
jgi:hypothetical protein